MMMKHELVAHVVETNYKPCDARTVPPIFLLWQS